MEMGAMSRVIFGRPNAATTSPAAAPLPATPGNERRKKQGDMGHFRFKATFLWQVAV